MKAFEVIQAHKRRQVARLLSLVVCVAVWSNLIFEVSTTSDYWWLLALIGVFVFYLSVMISEISSARPAALDSPAHQVSAIASPNVPSESLLEERFLLITTKARGELGAEQALRLQDLIGSCTKLGCAKLTNLISRTSRPLPEN